MKNLDIKIAYTWQDEKGSTHQVNAEIGGDWYQSGTKEDCAEILELTQALNDRANEFIVENTHDLDEL